MSYIPAFGKVALYPMKYAHGFVVSYIVVVTYPDSNPDSKVHGANMGPIWGGQDPGGPHVGPINFAISVTIPVDSF